jgi:ATP-dependent DNA ligase
LAVRDRRYARIGAVAAVRPIEQAASVERFEMAGAAWRGFARIRGPDMASLQRFPSKREQRARRASSFGADEGATDIEPLMSAYVYGFGDPCLPTRVSVAPSGAIWWHEVKHDGYRLMVRRTPSGVRITGRRSHT